MGPYTLARVGWGCSLIWAGEIPVFDIKVPCYFCGGFCESLGNRARWVKIGSPKPSKFPVNPCILLYGVRRKILPHRQEYDTSHGNPAGCSFSPRFRRFLLATVPVYTRHYTKSRHNSPRNIPCPKSRCQFLVVFFGFYNNVILT